MTSTTTNIHHPIRILSATKQTPVPAPETTVLQPKKDYQPRLENYVSNQIPPKPNKTIPNEPKNEPLYFKLPVRQPSKPKGEAQKQAEVIIKLNRKLKDMVREAAFLTELLYSHNISIPTNSDLQQRLKNVDDKNIEDQYNKIKRKTPTIRTQNSYDSPYVIHNPENCSQKSRKLQIKKCIDLKFIPMAPKSGKSLGKEVPPSPSKQPTKPIAHNDHSHKENAGKTNLTPFQFQHQIQHHHKRAEHYKLKTNQLQIALQQLLNEKTQIERINEEVNNQNIKLRSQLLSGNYKDRKL